MSHTSAASSAVLAATTSFRWVDLLEKEFDKVRNFETQTFEEQLNQSI